MSETTDAKAGWIRAALERFETPLTRYAFRITGDLERARDVVQDCFLSLCGESPARIDDHLAPWLFKVCRNRALDVRRKEARSLPLDDDWGRMVSFFSFPGPIGNTFVQAASWSCRSLPCGCGRTRRSDSRRLRPPPHATARASSIVATVIPPWYSHSSFPRLPSFF